MFKKGKKYPSFSWVKEQSSHLTHNAQQAASNTSDCTYKQDDKKNAGGLIIWAIQSQKDVSWEKIKQNSFPVKLGRAQADFWCSEG